jgi:hypothetical protein
MPVTNTIFSAAAAPSGLSVEPLTASLALAQATGSGNAFVYEVGSAATINLTAPNSTVGGVTTFVASNHGSGAKLLVSDSAAGQWDVSEVGAPASTSLAYGRINANLPLASTAFPNTGFGALIPFNNTIYSSGVTFSGATGIIPAKAGRYRASWLMVNGSEEFADNGYFHVVQNGVSLGQVLYNMMEAAGVNQCSGFIDVNVVAGQAVSLYYRTAHTADDSLSWDSGSYFQLDQLPSTETVQAGTVVPTTLLYGLYHADGTGANVSPSAGGDIPIGTALNKVEGGSGITFNGTTWTLPAGRWSLEADLNDGQGNTAPIFRFYNVTAGQYVGSIGQSAGQTANFSGEAVAKATVESASPIQLTLRAINATWQLTGGNPSVPSYVRIDQLPAHSIVSYTPGDVVVSDLARVRAEGGATITVTTSAQPVIYGTAITNIGGGYNATTGVFTAPSAGTYAIRARGYWNFPASAQAGTDFILSLRVNGVSVRQTNTENPSSIVYQPSAEVADTLTLAAGDQVSVHVIAGATITGTVTFVCNNTWGVFTVDQQPTGLLVDPGTVPVTTLTRGTVTSIVNTQTTTSTAWVDVTGGAIPLPSSGTFEIVYSVASANNTGSGISFFRLVNAAGAEVPGSISMVQSYVAGGRDTTSGKGVVTISGADTHRLQYRVNQGTTGIYNSTGVGVDNANSTITWEQKPTATVVNPGLVPVEDVEVLLGSGAGLTGTISMPWNQLQAAGYSHIRVFVGESVTSGSANRFTAGNVVPTSYLTGSAGGTSRYLAYGYADATNHIELYMTDETTAAVQISGATIGTNPAWEVYGIKPQKTVINTTDVPVVSPAPVGFSGYRDIGDIREQWGLITVGAGNSSTVNLPLPMANNDYNVQVTLAWTGGPQFKTAIAAQGSSSSFTVYVFQRDDGSQPGGNVYWRVLGRKP